MGIWQKNGARDGRERATGQCCIRLAQNQSRRNRLRDMGGGGTLVDGIRRLFQRRVSSSAAVTQSDKDDNGVDHNAENDHKLAAVRDLRAQLSAIPKQGREEGEEGHTSVVDFDISSLKLIRVPTRSCSTVAPMDPHKKVPFLFLLFLVLLSI